MSLTLIRVERPVILFTRRFKYIRIVSVRGEVVFLLIGIIVIWTGFDIGVPEMNNSNSLPVIF